MNAQPEWEIFEDRSLRGNRGRGAFSSIKPAGQITLTRAARELLGASAVLLAFDPHRLLIGLHPSTEDDPRAYQLTRRAGGGMITAKNFLRHHDLVSTEVKNCPVTQEGEWTVIHLTGVTGETQEGTGK